MAPTERPQSRNLRGAAVDEEEERESLAPTAVHATDQDPGLVGGFFQADRVAERFDRPLAFATVVRDPSGTPPWRTWARASSIACWQ
jgi:hypothetical protein